MHQVLGIAAFGAAGALLRYGTGWLAIHVFGKGFPFGTLLVNVLGCFVIGICYVLFVEKGFHGEFWRTSIVVGLLGSYTTFSAFSLETLILMEQKAYVAALLNVTANVVLCLLFAYAGIWAARAVLFSHSL